jgi:hypothetical protein
MLQRYHGVALAYYYSITLFCASSSELYLFWKYGLQHSKAYHVLSAVMLLLYTLSLCAHCNSDCTL